MKIARLHLYTNENSSQGYEFFGSMRAAKKAQTKFKRDFKADDPAPEIDTIEVDPSRAGIIKALNTYAGHADNG